MPTKTKTARRKRRQSLAHLPHVQAALFPTRYESMVKFARDKIILPRSSAEPGLLDLWRTPYMVQIAEDTINPGIRIITIIAPRQVAKTTLHIVIICWGIDQDAAPGLFLMGRGEDADIISQHRVLPILKASPKLWKYVTSATREIQKTLINLNECQWYFDTVRSPAAIASKPLKRVCGDELHLWPDDIGGEGDPIEIVKNTMVNYAESLFVQTSTATDDRAKIRKQFLLGDQNYFHTPCLDCGSEILWSASQIRIPAGVVEPQNIRGGELAWHECPVCGGKESDTGRAYDWQRMEAMRNGRWIPKRPLDNPMHRSYQIGIHSPWRGFSEIKALEIECGGDPLQLKAWTNTVCGEDYKDRVGSINLKIVDSLSGMLNTRGKVPTDAQRLTGGVDWHGRGKGLYWSLWAWGSRRRGWLVDYGRVGSDHETTRDWLDEVYGKLDAIFVGREWIPEGKNNPLGPWIGADSGYKGQDPDQHGGLAHRNQAYDYARRRPCTLACKGDDRPKDDRYIWEFKSKAESKFWAGLQINTGLCKSAFANYFENGMMSLNSDKAETESNYIQLANGTKQAFMEAMVSEEQVRDDKGNKTWEVKGGENHFWDTAIIAFAMALNRGWARLVDPVDLADKEEKPAARQPAQSEGRKYGPRQNYKDKRRR